MPWKESEAVPEGNGPIPQQEEFGSGEPTLADIHRICEERFDRMDSNFDRWNRKLDEILDETKVMDQHVTSLEHGVRQPPIAMEADGPVNTKTCERTEGDATAVQAMRGDGFSARRVEPGPNTNSTSFGVKAEAHALPCRDDVVVESGDAVPKSCLPSLEMRLSTAPGGLVPTGEASTPTDTSSTATETNFNQPLLGFYTTEETEANCKKISTPYASYDSSAFQESNLPATLYCRRVVETKSRQNGTFDPRGSQGHLCACPFLGS